MNVTELEELLGHCPTLYHMAERGSWPSIRKFGLQSTTALLDRFGMKGEERTTIEARRRPKSVSLTKQGMPEATIRDQLPMDDAGLKRCLGDGLTPADWYELLNSKVFFWLTRDRLQRLLNAGAYCRQEHDVLELDARSLVSTYKSKIWFCPMNSGCTKPFPHPRGKDTFQRIGAYEYSYWRARRKSGERVVELAVDYAVPDIVKYVKRVTRMKGTSALSTLFDPEA